MMNLLVQLGYLRDNLRQLLFYQIVLWHELLEALYLNLSGLGSTPLQRLDERQKLSLYLTVLLRDECLLVL